nr:unnamed protein product [Callosobruchus chinensis]
MIWYEHASSIATAAEKKARISIQSQKLLLTIQSSPALYKAQIRPSLEYCSHICRAAAPTTLFILDAVQRRAIRLISDPPLTCNLQLFSHRLAVSEFSLFYRYSKEVSSSELAYHRACYMCPQDFFFSPQGGRSSCIKN